MSHNYLWQLECERENIHVLLMTPRTGWAAFVFWFRRRGLERKHAQLMRRIAGVKLMQMDYDPRN